MGLDKKLGVWKKDKIVREDGKYHASDYYCVKCYKDKKEVPASAFWPVIDIDIPSFPYCEKHISQLRTEVILNTIDEDWAK